MPKKRSVIKDSLSVSISQSPLTFWTCISINNNISSFWLSNFFIFGQWNSLQHGPCVFWDIHVSFGALLAFWHIKIVQVHIILFFCRLGFRHFFKNFWFFKWRKEFRNQYMGKRCAQWYWGIISGLSVYGSGVSQTYQHTNSHVYIHTHTHMPFLYILTALDHSRVVTISNREILIQQIFIERPPWRGISNREKEMKTAMFVPT